jgi:hypothetical protein
MPELAKRLLHAQGEHHLVFDDEDFHFIQNIPASRKGRLRLALLIV